MPMPAQPVYNYGSLPYPTQATQPGPQYNMFSDGVNVPPPTAPPAPAHTPDPTFDCTQAYTPGAETLSICRRTGQGPIWLGIWYDSPLRMLSWERVEERLDNIAWRRIFYELVSCRARVNWDIRVLGDEMIKAGIQFDTLPLVLPQTDFHQPCVYGVDWAPPDWPWNASG
ncbi:uncharacterized protein N7483_001815 [Penicillium malachiteum]|uniref:uncharacterized protein n=1 Tax=Penicillium malachiteum TaxID=1324776 RepID=UPI0025478195|nr:uncharacterized protein N7483_001815 [Penicillium malachiteum]KAJ5736690.1 hypothetical protein N7483_001815 [Penicillium malachiteum]